MNENKNPMILTLKVDGESQRFFDTQRERYFPPKRNHLQAHLTLFHQLPNEPETIAMLTDLEWKTFELTVNGLRHLGAGVAYTLDAPELTALRRQLSARFSAALIAQDRQPFQPHITIQNKVKPEASRELYTLLSDSFAPFTVQALGLALWTYLGGPWQHESTFLFRQPNAQGHISGIVSEQ